MSLMSWLGIPWFRILTNPSFSKQETKSLAKLVRSSTEPLINWDASSVVVAGAATGTIMNGDFSMLHQTRTGGERRKAEDIEA